MSDKTVPWFNLPLELVEQEIIDSFLCDNESLLSLSKTCHLLNRLALEEFFEQNDVEFPSEGYIDSYLAPKELTPALHAALWLNDLSNIEYHFNPDIQRLFFEIRGLTALIGRLPGCRTLVLGFGAIDRWLRYRGGRNSRSDMKVLIEQDSFKDIFCRLLDVAVETKVEEIEVTGGNDFRPYYESDDGLEDSDVLEQLPAEEEIFATSSSPSIRRFHLSSSLMIQALFRPYTLNLLQKNSGTLQLFAYEYDTSHVSNANFDHQILLPFLGRHPTIAILKLYGIALLPKELPILEHSILPNLKMIEAHPRIISYILSSPLYCPALVGICISSQYYGAGQRMPDAYEDFDEALLAIASLRRLIYLRYKLYTSSGLAAWFLHHTNNPNANIIPYNSQTSQTS